MDGSSLDAPTKRLAASHTRRRMFRRILEVGLMVPIAGVLSHTIRSVEALTQTNPDPLRVGRPSRPHEQ